MDNSEILEHFLSRGRPYLTQIEFDDATLTFTLKKGRTVLLVKAEVIDVSEDESQNEPSIWTTEGWLKKEFERHKNFAEIARANGLDDKSDGPRMNKYAIKVLNWNINGGNLLLRWRFLLAYFVSHDESSRPNVTDISRSIGANYTTCIHWRLAAEEKLIFLPTTLDDEQWQAILDTPHELLYPGDKP